MISTSAKDYWRLCQSFRAPGTSGRMQELILQGEALITLQVTTSEAVRSRLLSFIEMECFVHNITNKSALFVKS